MSRVRSKPAQGFTLVELMVVIAIIAVISAIAVPLYNGYIREARLGTAKINADSMRIFLEDFRLDYNTYRVGGLDTLNETQLYNNLGWSPDGDSIVGNDPYTYTVTVTDNTYDILVEHPSGDWLFCEDRMTNCCDNKTSGATTSDCP